MIDYQSEGTDLFVVLHGHLRVVVSVAGRETILRDLHAGDYFGELAALDMAPRSAGILAMTEATLARMPATVFRRAIHQLSDVCDQFSDNRSAGPGPANRPHACREF